MTASRDKYLIKNTAILTIGSLGSKIITFFLIPLYTNSLSTTQYGIVDLIVTINTVLAPIVTVNIGEAVMRFALDVDADKIKLVVSDNAFILLLYLFLYCLFLFLKLALVYRIMQYTPLYI